MMKDMNVSSKAKGTGKYAASGRVKEEPETVSDAEAMSSDEDMEEEGGAGLVEPDEDEEPSEDAMFAEGLKARYEAALRDQQGGPAAAARSADHIKRSQG